MVLAGDSWSYGLQDDDDLRRAVVLGMRSLQMERAGWNSIIDRELDRQRASGPEHGNATNATVHVAALGNLSLTRVDSETLRLTLPSDADAHYFVSTPETIRVVVPARALQSNAVSIVATPDVRFDALGGSASVRGTLIADPDPVQYGNRTLRMSVTLTLPAALGYAWWGGLLEQDGPATLALLQLLTAKLPGLNGTTRDGFDNLCSKDSLAQRNATVPVSGGAAEVGSTVTNASGINASLSAHPNGTSTLSGLAAFCTALGNVSVVNGTVLLRGSNYSSYCDVCLLGQSNAPRDLNHSSLTLIDNYTLAVDLPTTFVFSGSTSFSISIPSEALVLLLSPLNALAAEIDSMAVDAALLTEQINYVLPPEARPDCALRLQTQLCNNNEVHAVDVLLSL